MAKMRVLPKTLALNCPPDFETDPTESATYETVDDEQLALACSTFKEVTTNPDLLGTHAGKFVRAAYFPAAELRQALEKTEGPYLRVYQAILGDGNGPHFMFMAPVDTAGKALVGEDVVLPACIGPTPPCPEINDRYVR